MGSIEITPGFEGVEALRMLFEVTGCPSFCGMTEGAHETNDGQIRILEGVSINGADQDSCG
jgi:hypothetical protein